MSLGLFVVVWSGVVGVAAVISYAACVAGGKADEAMGYD